MKQVLALLLSLSFVHAALGSELCSADVYIQHADNTCTDYQPQDGSDRAAGQAYLDAWLDMQSGDYLTLHKCRVFDVGPNIPVSPFGPNNIGHNIGLVAPGCELGHVNIPNPPTAPPTVTLGTAIIRSSHVGSGFLVPLYGTDGFYTQGFSCDMTVRNVHAFCIGVNAGPDEVGFTNWVEQDVTTSASSDGLYIQARYVSGISNGANRFSQWDTNAIFICHGTLVFNNPVLGATGDSTELPGLAHAFNVSTCYQQPGSQHQQISDAVITVVNPQWFMYAPPGTGPQHGVLGIISQQGITTNVQGGQEYEFGGNGAGFAENNKLGVPAHAGNIHISNNHNLLTIFGSPNDDGTKVYQPR